MSPENDEEDYLVCRMQKGKPARVEGEAAKASHPQDKTSRLAYQQYHGCSCFQFLAKKAVDQIVWISLSQEDL